MTSSDIKRRAKKEYKRIHTLLSDVGVSEKRMSIMDPVIVNTSWMKAKLDDAMEEIEQSSVVIDYDNGGGQKGIRENPLFKGYEALWKSYMLGMSKIMDCLPQEVVKQEMEVLEKPKTMLELVRSKHTKDA